MYFVNYTPDLAGFIISLPEYFADGMVYHLNIRLLIDNIHSTQNYKSNWH